jgi:hypothetical protein
MKKNILLLVILYFSYSLTYSQCWESLGVKGDTSSVQLAIRYDGSLWILIPGRVPSQVGSDSNWHMIFDGEESVLGIKTDSTMWGWGSNSNGQLGINNRSVVDSPILLNNEKWIDVASSSACTMAIKSDHTLWYWGDYSQLTPIQIGTDNDWNKVHLDYYSVMVIKNNGTLWKGSPGNVLTQVGTDNDWNYLWVYQEEWFGIKNNGTLWENGVKVGTDNDWKFIVHDNYNLGVKFAIKTNQTLWFWSGSTSNTPVQFNTHQNWKQVGVNYNGTYYAIDYTGEYWQGNVGDSLLPSTVNSLCSPTNSQKLSRVTYTQAYPNPTNGKFYLKLGEYSNNVNYSIINIHGKTIMTGVLDKIENFLDLSKINSGIYFIKVENDTSIKIIKQ